MTNRTRSPENMNESFGSLHRMILDAPLNVWTGVCAPHELEATLSACCELPFYTHDHQATDDGTKQGEDR